ncbi:uncharacterized protein METZ01_LOCUS460056, partial [marine metagenome]
MFVAQITGPWKSFSLGNGISTYSAVAFLAIRFRSWGS